MARITGAGDDKTWTKAFIGWHLAAPEQAAQFGFVLVPGGEVALEKVQRRAGGPPDGDFTLCGHG